MPVQPSPTPAAQRSRAYRGRRRDGFIVVPLDVHWEDLDVLERRGFIEESERGDRARIAEGIDELLTWLGAGVFVIDEEALDEYLQSDA